MLSVIPHYLGGYVEVSPDNQQAIRRHVEALSDAASPLSPPWVFPLEIFQARQTLRRVVLESKQFNLGKVEAESAESVAESVTEQ